ncbi:MAG: helix-turn-helix domain-containing protein [Leadbetterella sp.]|nr:helix-turn-helix domain-containing protein [Leadbetterella sp.]
MARIKHILLIFILFGLFNRTDAQDFVFSTIDVSQGLSDNQIRYISQLPDGRMVFTTSGSINIYDGSCFRYIHRLPGDIFPLPNYDGFYRIYQGNDSLLWIKEKHKLMCVDLRTEKYIDPLSTAVSKDIINNIDDIFMDENKRIWLLSRDKLIHKSGKFTINIPRQAGKLQDITSDPNHVFLFFDTGSLYCYNLSDSSWEFVSPAYQERYRRDFANTSLVIKSGKKIYQVRNGKKGGFFSFDISKRQWKTILQTNYRLNTLIVTADDTAYITCEGGIWMINLQTDEQSFMRVLKTVEGRKIQTMITTIFSDRRQGIWVGTLNQGLLYYHPARFKLRHIGKTYFNEEDTDLEVLGFAQDTSGDIYVKTQKQIYRYESIGDNGHKFIPVPTYALPGFIKEKFDELHITKDLKADETVRLIDSRGWKWTGTRDGLRLLRAGIEKEQIFYTKDGLSNNFIQALLEDRNGDIWVTSSAGISKIHIEDTDKRLHFSTFNTLNGALHGEYSLGSIYQAADSTLYFGGINGFNTLKSNTKTEASLPFRPVFINLFLKGQLVEIGNIYDHRIILSKSPAFTKNLELSYDQNFLTFEFSALNYQNPEQTYYRYKMVGVDQQWRSVANESQTGGAIEKGILRASYTNLSPGNYTLLVAASADNVDWSVGTSKISITITPPWWKSNFAYMIYTALVISFVFLFAYSYSSYTKRKLKRKHNEDILLLRIRNLIDQCNLLEAEKGNYLSAEIKTEEPSNAAAQQHNLADTDFLRKAMEFINKNLNEPDYSVGQLSRDLCMDRTGLYRKLVGLLDKSPSLFIRSIRLQRAAQLIIENELSIAEIAENVGFSSSSYLSKCFQQQYGCKPSEYALKAKKST